MAFRVPEAIEEGLLRAETKLISRLTPENRENSRIELQSVIHRYGPVIDYYPYWHPLVSFSPEHGHAAVDPRNIYKFENGNGILDHTIFLRNAIISCSRRNTTDIVDWLSKQPEDPEASLRVHKLGFPLYSEGCEAILIVCEWNAYMESGHFIPPCIAIPRLLETELPNRFSSTKPESWITVRSMVLGEPCGARSSLFVRPETGQKLKRIWNELMDSGAFGPPLS